MTYVMTIIKGHYQDHTTPLKKTQREGSEMGKGISYWATDGEHSYIQRMRNYFEWMGLDENEVRSLILGWVNDHDWSWWEPGQEPEWVKCWKQIAPNQMGGE